MTGRVRTYEAIVKGHNVPTPGVPESFKVLVKELQSLCLDIQVLDEDGNQIELKEDEDALDTFNLARHGCRRRAPERAIADDERAGGCGTLTTWPTRKWTLPMTTMRRREEF